MKVCSRPVRSPFSSPWCWRSRATANSRKVLLVAQPHCRHCRRLPQPAGRARRSFSLQISVCSAISRASSTSIPKYRTVDSNLE
jgi:hypothetical protein